MNSGPVQRRGRCGSLLAGAIAAALFLAAVPGAVRAQQTYDSLLKGGRVIDPKNGIDARMDVAVAARKIAKIAPDIPEASARQVIPVKGLYVVPGLVDLHVHVYAISGVPR